MIWGYHYFWKHPYVVQSPIQPKQTKGPPFFIAQPKTSTETSDRPSSAHPLHSRDLLRSSPCHISNGRSRSSRHWVTFSHRFSEYISMVLVGGWTNPLEKYAREFGSFSQVGVKVKKVWNHHLVVYLPTFTTKIYKNQPNVPFWTHKWGPLVLVGISALFLGDWPEENRGSLGVLGRHTIHELLHGFSCHHVSVPEQGVGPQPIGKNMDVLSKPPINGRKCMRYTSED